MCACVGCSIRVSARRNGFRSSSFCVTSRCETLWKSNIAIRNQLTHVHTYIHIITLTQSYTMCKSRYNARRCGEHINRAREFLHLSYSCQCVVSFEHTNKQTDQTGKAGWHSIFS